MDGCLETASKLSNQYIINFLQIYDLSYNFPWNTINP
jgi:hypothetical protein